MGERGERGSKKRVRQGAARPWQCKRAKNGMDGKEIRFQPALGAARNCLTLRATALTEQGGRAPVCGARGGGIKKTPSDGAAQGARPCV